MRTLLLIALITVSLSTKATTYYFSTTGHDDDNSGTSDQSPWKTLTKFNDVFSSLAPGDNVLFKRGEKWYGNITISRSGTAALPIVIGAYGTGNRPIITLLVTLTGWTNIGGGKWSNYSLAQGSMVNMVVVDNTPRQLGRYPNADASNKGYLNISSVNGGNTSITDNNLSLQNNYWKDAEIVLRTRRWILDRKKIVSNDDNTFTFSATQYTASSGYGYFIQNDEKTLDQFGEWYLHSQSNALKMYFGGSPTSHTIQASSGTNLVTATNQSYITFTDITFSGANNHCFNLSGGSHFIIKNCDILFSGINGINNAGHDYLTVEGCSIKWCNNNGISNNTAFISDNLKIRYNTISNTHTFAGMGQSGDGNGIAIYNKSATGAASGNLCEYNKITNTGYSAIFFWGDGAIVNRNYIDGYCINKDDGGGIYTFEQAGTAGHYNRKVTNNIVVNGLGAPEGTDNAESRAHGIYFDDRSAGTMVTGNTIYNCNRGLFIHNAFELTVTNNTFYHTNYGVYSVDDLAGKTVHSNVITNNIFFAKLISQECAYFQSNEDQNRFIGTIDNNYYCRPLDDRLTITNRYVTSEGITEYLDLAKWQDKYDYDANSKISPKAILPYKVNSITSGNVWVNSTFDANTNNVDATNAVKSWENLGKLDGGYLKVTPSSKNNIIYDQVGNLSKDATYLVRFSIVGSQNSPQRIEIFLRNGSGSYSAVSDSRYRSSGNSRRTYEVLLTCHTASTTGELVFKADFNTTWYLDNIQLYKVSATITDPEDHIKFEYNATSEDRTISLNGDEYIGVNGVSYTQDIKLKPYTSIILIKDEDVLLSPLADAYVRDGSSYVNTNYGTATDLVVKTSTAGFTRHAYLKFALNDLTAITSAKLRVYGNCTTAGESVSMSAYSIADDSWIESGTGGITWNNKPAPSGSPLSSVPITDQLKYYEFDVTNFVRAEIAADRTAGFLVKNIASTVETLSFKSKENGQYPPQLIVVTPINGGTAARSYAVNKIYAEANSISESAISVYPNPVYNTLKVLFPANSKEKYHFQLIDAVGRTHQLGKQQIQSGSYTFLNIVNKNRNPGIYFLKITSRQGTSQTIKLLLQ